MCLRKLRFLLLRNIKPESQVLMYKSSGKPCSTAIRMDRTTKTLVDDLPENGTSPNITQPTFDVLSNVGPIGV